MVISTVTNMSNFDGSFFYITVIFAVLLVASLA